MRMLVLSSSYRAPLMSMKRHWTLPRRTWPGCCPVCAWRRAPRLASLLRLPRRSPGSVRRARTAFIEAMDDDFNTPLALASLFNLVKSINAARDQGANDEQLKPAQAALRELSGVLVCASGPSRDRLQADPFVELLVEVRSEVRKQKLWRFSDLIRDRLAALGIALEDSKDGTDLEMVVADAGQTPNHAPGIHTRSRGGVQARQLEHL